MSFPKYEHYKDSGVEWLGEVPAHWIIGPYKHLVDIQNGADHKNIEQSDGYPVIGSGGPFAFASEYIYDGESVLLGRKGTINKPLYVSGKFWTVDTMYWTKIPPTVDAKFAYYCATIIPFDFYSTNTALPSMTKGVLSAHITAYPELREQKLIAEFLTRETAKLDALITEQRTLIDLLKEKRQAVISHAVTKGLDPRVPMKDSGVEWLGEVPAHWDVTKAGRYLSILPGYAFPSTEFSLDEANTKLLRGINVGVSKIKWDEAVYWRRFDGDGLDVFELADGDIVIGMDRPYISEGMRVARISEADLPCLLLQRVAAIRASGKLSDDHILLLLSSNMFLDHFSPETTGVSVPHISPSQIAEFIIPIPPLEEQKDIFKWVEVETTRIDALTAEAQTTIALLQERRSALISAAVTGKIDVRQAA